MSVIYNTSELEKAINANDFNTVKALLDRGASPHVYCTFGLLAKKTDNIDILKLLIKYGFDIGEIDMETVIMEANLEVFELILQKYNFDPNKPIPSYYGLPLLCAIHGARLHGDTSMIKKLLDMGARPQMKYYGNTLPSTALETLEYFMENEGKNNLNTEIKNLIIKA